MPEPYLMIFLLGWLGQLTLHDWKDQRGKSLERKAVGAGGHLACWRQGEMDASAKNKLVCKANAA